MAQRWATFVFGDHWVIVRNLEKKGDGVSLSVCYSAHHAAACSVAHCRWPPAAYCLHCSLSQGHAAAARARRKHELAISNLPESFPSSSKDQAGHLHFSFRLTADELHCLAQFTTAAAPPSNSPCQPLRPALAHPPSLFFPRLASPEVAAPPFPPETPRHRRRSHPHRGQAAPPRLRHHRVACLVCGELLMLSIHLIPISTAPLAISAAAGAPPPAMSTVVRASV
jgi:hypothetical protein